METSSFTANPNDLAQAPPAQDNQEVEQATAGGCPAAPCSLPGVGADSEWIPPIMGDFI